ncbi:MAG: radical SAM protein, partial [Proteobacteria bacterium]|nr:radical SAM protein [Pseudomonadota bacterium]
SKEQDFWLRIFYTYPNRYPAELFELMNQDSRLVPYVDLPFQHVSDPVLKAMNRKITRAKLEELVETALTKVDSIALRSTFIVGFPNETEKEFQELLEFVEMGYFNHVGVFVYSHEENIDSFDMGDRIPEEVKHERRDLLMQAQQRVSLQKNQAMVGQTQKVLVEGEYEETELLMKGRNQFQGVEIDGVVLINEGTAQIGQFNTVEITEAHPYDLIGRIIEQP